MSVRVTQIAVNGFDENFSYIIHDEFTRQGFIVDPSGSFNLVQNALETLRIKVIGILITHTHGDHIDALSTAQDVYKVPVYVHESGIEFLTGSKICSLRENQKITLGKTEIQVLYTPGHNKDSVCFLIAAHDGLPPQLVSGDTIFVSGCGRTTTDGIENLFDSLQRLKKLPSDTIIYPGHDYGPAPTAVLGDQLLNNPYLGIDSLEEFKSLRLG